MIDLHTPRKGREHLRVDQAGLRHLAEMTLQPSERLAQRATVTLAPHLTGINVFVDSCPCDRPRVD